MLIAPIFGLWRVGDGSRCRHVQCGRERRTPGIWQLHPRSGAVVIEVWSGWVPDAHPSPAASVAFPWQPPSLSGSSETPWCKRFTAEGVIGDPGVCVNGGAWQRNCRRRAG